MPCNFLSLPAEIRQRILAIHLEPVKVPATMGKRLVDPMFLEERLSKHCKKLRKVHPTVKVDIGIVKRLWKKNYAKRALYPDEPEDDDIPCGFRVLEGKNAEEDLLRLAMFRMMVSMLTEIGERGPESTGHRPLVEANTSSTSLSTTENHNENTEN